MNEEVTATARRIAALIEGGAVRRARLFLIQLHPADQADVLNELDDDEWDVLVGSLANSDIAKLLSYFGERERAELLKGFDASRLSNILLLVPEDLAADVVQMLDDEVGAEVLSLVGRERLEELVTYEEESAGGRMSTEMLLLHDFWTIERTLDFIRRFPISVTGRAHFLVVDDYGSLVGTITPGHLVTYPATLTLESVMDRNPITVPLGYDQEEAALRMRHYNLLALPVVDNDGRVHGVLTADEVLDIQVEEATEDIYKMAGLAEEERLFRPVRESIPPRLAWLSFNLITAFAAATIIHTFEGTIERVAVLAVFMPMVAGMAGNAGLQTLTLVVRSIALGEVQPTDAITVLKRELVIGLFNGLVIGLAVGAIAWVWHGSAWLGAIVAAALLANIVNAALGGVVVPLVLRRVKIDPALASGVIVMSADIVGFLIFLGLGTLLVSELD